VQGQGAVELEQDRGRQHRGRAHHHHHHGETTLHQVEGEAARAEQAMLKAGPAGNIFSKVLCIVSLCSKCTRALTFESLRQPTRLPMTTRRPA
jgi:hypothetical protein